MKIDLYIIVGLVLIAVFTMTSELTEAAVYTCEVNGKKVFQGTPCANKNAFEQSGNTREFGNKVIHSSWFDQPKNLTSDFTCDDTGCTCRFENDSQRIAKYRFFRGNRRLLLPMSTFKEAWQHYYNRQQPDSRERKDPAFRDKRVKLRQFSACQIAFRQHALRKFYSPVSFEIKQNYERLLAEQDKIYERCGGTPEQNLEGPRAERWLNCTSKNNPSLKKLKQKIGAAKTDVEDLESLTRMMRKPVKEVINLR